MTEETWNAARLIPTSGINGADEQERRATSAMLAVMASVREFGRAITQPLGAPAASLETYIEVPFELGDRKVYPDGLIRATRGKRTWTALIEVKTGTNDLRAEQIEDYLDVAKANDFDVVLTISNQLEPQPGVHPVKVDARKTKKVTLAHLSWTQVLSTAVMEKVHRGIADPDQAWILGELIRYLEHPRSGAMEFDDMGEHWVAVRNAVEAGTLRPSDRGVKDVASRWDQLVRYACLRLGRELGVEVQPVLTRKELSDPALRNQSVVTALTEQGRLVGQVRIPDTAGTITLTADLRAQRIEAAIDIEAPREGRAQTRVNRLLRQLKEAPDALRIDAFAVNARGASTSELLSTARQDPALLIGDPRKELRSFHLVLSAPMGGKRGHGRGSFIGSVLSALDGFYETTVQHLKPWSAAPPKMRNASDEVEDEVAEQVASEGIRPADASAAPSSQDGAWRSGPVANPGAAPAPRPQPVAPAAAGFGVAPVGSPPATNLAGEGSPSRSEDGATTVDDPAPAAAADPAADDRIGRA